MKFEELCAGLALICFVALLALSVIRTTKEELQSDFENLTRRNER